MSAMDVLKLVASTCSWQKDRVAETSSLAKVTQEMWVCMCVYIPSMSIKHVAGKRDREAPLNINDFLRFVFISSRNIASESPGTSVPSLVHLT